MLSISISFQQIRERLRGLLLLACSFLLIQELQWSQLTVWPVDHSCRVHRNSTKDLYKLDLDPTRRYLDQVIQLSLFDVAQEESPLVAKATSEGINYEDIAHCYEHPVDTDELGQTIVDRDNIEPCRSGIHFDEAPANLSVVAHFQLVCEHQWMRMLLPAGIGVGFILGTLLAYAISHSLFPSILRCRYFGAIQDLNQLWGVDREDTFNTWITFQAFGVLFTWIFVRDLPRNYSNIVASALLRTLTAALCLARVLFDWPQVEEAPLPGSASSDGLRIGSLHLLAENGRCFVAAGWIYIIMQALYEPLTLRLFTNWVQLNRCLTLEVMGLILATATSQVLCKPTWGKLRSNESTINSDTEAPVRPNESHFRPEGPPKLCEFCLINEEPLHAIAMIHQGIGQQQQEQHQQLETGIGGGDLYDSSVQDTINGCAPYQPTTVPNYAFEGACWQGNGPGGNQHNFGSFHRNLLTRTVTCQLWLLAFCLALNYFLLRFLPDHSLLHSESLASRVARKIHYRDTHPLNSSLVAGNGSASVESFDYSSINRATRAVEQMKNSLNPLQVLSTTALVNGWPVELSVMLLHVVSVSPVAASYLKLKRLLTLVSFGSLVLTVEWILIGLLRGRNHLIEWAWLHSVCLLVARFGATLVLFNYFFTALKISRRLRTDQLIRFLPSALAAGLALVLASQAPVLESVNLAIVPIGLAINNAIAYLISRSLGARFRASLCPMLFSGHHDDDRRHEPAAAN